MECRAIVLRSRWDRSLKIGFFVGLGSLVCLACLMAAVWSGRPTAEDLQQRASEALARRDYLEAERLVRQLLAHAKARPAGLLILAETAIRRGQPDMALNHLDQMPDAAEVREVAALMRARLECDDLHQPSRAEQTLTAALDRFPNSQAAREMLVFLLGISGRSWEAIPHRLILIGQDPVPIHHLSLLALGNTAAENPEILTGMAAQASADPLVLCGLARVDIREGRVDDAERRLDQALAQRPDLFTAQAWKGELLLDRQDDAGFRAWHARLPTAADANPQIWFVRGRRAALQQDRPGAARCFWECLIRDPNHQTACYQLATVLGELGDTARADAYRQRARWLTELITAAKTLEITGSLSVCERAAVACTELGLQREAEAWRRARARSVQTWNRMASSSTVLSPSERVLPECNTPVSVSMLEFPLPELLATRAAHPAGTAPETRSHLAFADVQQDVGIQFRYRNGRPPNAEGNYFHEFSGGGIAALDFDLDGWCDLYLTQGSDHPPTATPTGPPDALYRNTGVGKFEDRTAESGLNERGFSQGCAVGDIDSDGFPDIFVANIGANSLFRNNGDGTFTEISSQVRLGEDLWTTSAAIADLNGDGLADIYAVNYVTGNDLFREPCRRADGAPRICTPHEFPAADDQLLINRGDGTFDDQSEAAGIRVADGKGLGLVVADFDDAGRLSIFVANDAVPNFFFRNLSERGQAGLRFEEQGYLTGLAVDADGQPQACMGVAAGDANRDGGIDLFVTNFYNESNTLYLKQPGETFVDSTRTARLREPGFAMLGFGTQFLDADLDGWQDLVVTNGHVGDLTHAGIPYEMPCQVFRNQQDGRFEEVPARQLGRFFEGRFLGRGLARLDWNRDGREDFAVSFLQSPAALVENRTQAAGHFLVVRLHGVESARDAIGARVTVKCGSWTSRQQLTAGDGYQASNQRQLVFGLGAQDRIDTLEIRWPSGRIQQLAGMPVDGEIVVVEGRGWSLVRAAN